MQFFVLKIAAQEAVSTFTTKDEWDINQLINQLSDLQVFSAMEEFDAKLANQAKFLRNFMHLLQVMLLFVRATRQGLWDLHLVSLDMFTKFFFAYDQINYARLTPVYLSEMYALQSNDVQSWNFLKEGNFSVNKSPAPFSALGTDHALEQENKKMKVLGGIRGIANKTQTLENYFLVSPTLANITETFCDKFSIQKIERKDHYQLRGSTNMRYANNVAKLTAVYSNHDVNFGPSSDVFNIVTKVVLPACNADLFLSHEDIGRDMYNTFKSERLEGTKSVWDPMVKKKLPTFSETVKSFKMKIGNKVVQLKEEKQLMSKFVIASRKRDNIDLPYYFGRHEFAIVPRSMFRADGSLLLETDKASVMHQIEGLISSSNVNEDTTDFVCENIETKSIIFDGMAIVNQIRKTPQIRTCKDLAKAFLQRIKHESRGYGEVRVIFDRYQENSIKDQTRQNRTKGVQIRYKISDDTNIVGVTMKKLLSHVLTKQELTKFLSDHLEVELQKLDKKYAIAHQNVCCSNIQSFPPELLTHEHEEADTLMLLHAIDVAKDPLKDLTICSPDTDVFLLLIYYQESLCNRTLFRTGRGKDVREIDIREAYEAVGATKAASILGFHAFTGSDFTSKFKGKSKVTCWKLFFQANPEVLCAFSLLGKPGEVPMEELTTNLERFVMNLYCSKQSNSVENLADLRWYLFSKHQWESDKLPPTPSALKYKILRSYFVCRIWTQSHKSYPEIPDPALYGWERNEGALLPCTTDLPPAPTAIVEMCLCGCTTGCISMKCTCNKARLVCTDMCVCENCENDEQNENVENESDSSDDGESNEDD